MIKREIRVFKDTEELVENTAKKWIEVAEESIITRGMFTVGLSGGKMPEVLFKKLVDLSDYGPSWDDAQIFMVDERMVSHDSEDSNYNMMKKEFFDRINIKESSVHPMPVDPGNASTSADEYEKALLDFFKPEKGAFPAFDLILLGIGEDGHTASLFPGSNTLNENEHLVVADESERSGYKRVSLSLPVINSARNVMFFVSGDKKAEAVKKVVRGNPDMPAALVNPVNGNLFFMLDEQSGRYLEG